MGESIAAWLSRESRDFDGGFDSKSEIAYTFLQLRFRGIFLV